MPSGAEVQAGVAGVRARIASAAARSGRDPATVRLVAATKTVDLDRILAAHAAGLRDFAENHAQELAAKAPRVPGATWHFIGKVQRGTASKIAAHAAWIHSAEPGGAIEAVARRAARDGRRIDSLIEVDFTAGRQGVRPERLDEAIDTLAALDGLRLAGLMTVPPPTPTPEGARAYFTRLRELRDGLANTVPGFTELSMGMSGDYEVAVEEGATMVRVGRALFGERPGTSW
jgi:PLP dependent protein